GKKMTKSITPEKLYEKILNNENVIVVDLRSPEKFKAQKIEGKSNSKVFNIYYATMLETGEIDKDMQNYINNNFSKMFSKNDEIYTVCDVGETAKIFAKNLSELGYNAYFVEGGMKNWYRYYDYKTVIENSDLAIYQVSRVSRGDLSWVIISNGEATIIDPLRHIDEYINFVNSKNAKIKFVLDTHIHADHISGGPALSKKLNVPYYFHPYDGIHPIDMVFGKVDYNYLKDGDVFALGKVKVEVIHAPGHTLGQVVFLVDGKFLFTGDSIFIESVARPDLGGRGETWAPIHAKTLYKLVTTLSDDVMVLPAHFSKVEEANDKGLYVEKLGVLKEKNEALNYLLTKGTEEFVNYLLSSLPHFPP
ncbi:MAG: MBL fold metallo-hydrolase, partial [Sulfurihydrogenibium azorense]